MDRGLSQCLACAGHQGQGEEQGLGGGRKETRQARSVFSCFQASCGAVLRIQLRFGLSSGEARWP
jgi:hypothetical protein